MKPFLANKYILLAVLIIGVMAALVYSLPPVSLGAQDEAEGRIAYVDVQAVFDVHPGKGGAEEQLNEAAQSMQAELEEKAQDVSESEQKELLEDYQSELSSKEEELITGILEDINQTIKQVAEEQQVRVVLDKKNIIYGGYDLTDDVIEYIRDREQSGETQESESEGSSLELD